MQGASAIFGVHFVNENVKGGADVGARGAGVGGAGNSARGAPVPPVTRKVNAKVNDM